ncbi:DsbA family protein [Rhodosalinus halophilus]|jgi:protein-disulfide isomerase|uniref:DsbA family protein n=1 Tax=Rhodosalinus halophilus TaxID=2259333 RepID=A0A365UEI6_9RHOB|nr:DsbA family protein [Rhodosalinus halophilus]RBI87124.1 DsbA family protein [Rhodosalinus halophilus]
MTLFRPLSGTVLAAALAAAPAAALDLTDMTEAEREAFRAEVRAYLLDNPEVIMEAVAVLEEREAAAQEAADREMVKAHAEEIFDDGYSWVGGNPDGDVTLVEFIDYRCGYCRRAHDEVNELVESDGDIRLVIKEFPILGPDSLASSRFAIATKQVAGDEAYHAAKEALIRMTGEVNEVTLTRLAESLGLDADEILLQMQSPDVDEVIARTRALAQRLGISGTPTFVLPDRMVRGYVPLENMREIVADVREAS